MLLLTEDQTRRALPFPELIDALDDMFRKGCVMPTRHHHDMDVPGEPSATLLLMPAWQPGAFSGVKVANVVPGNSERGLPAVSAQYLLSDARTGQMLALVDGGELTARRTAAASALAARRLARADARRMLMIGTGRLARNLILAHSAVRSIEQVVIWGRSQAKAQALIEDMQGETSAKLSVANDLETELGNADIVSTATLSSDPLVRGDLLRPGTHVDLVGAFKPDMRESDDALVRRASVFVDTRDGCLAEGGDIVQPIRDAVITAADVRADLYQLSRGEHPGRTGDDEVTVFKSVGAALEDLAGAILAYRSQTG